MNKFDLVISIVFVIGFTLILYLVLRDPIYIFKALLRGLKTHPNWIVRIIFSLVWGAVWIIDKMFGFKLYIREFEEASKLQQISFLEYDKYIWVNTTNLKHIKNVLKSFENDYDPVEYNYSLNGCKIEISEHRESAVLKPGKDIEFKSFNHLIHYLDNSAPQSIVYNVKGVLLNQRNRAKSYFIFPDMAFPIKLIGKTYTGKKMYVDINPSTELNDTIYFNSNMEYFKNLNFDQFENDIDKLNFKEID